MKSDRLISLALLVVALTALTGLAVITVFIFKEGLPIIAKAGLKDFLFSNDWRPQKGHFGILFMIVGSLWVTFGAMVIGGTFGVGCAIVLTEFCPRQLLAVLKPSIELLAGIPSVVYGFMGVVLLLPFIREHFGGPGPSILAASIMLGVMILPTVASISVDAIRAVPRAYYEGSIALGATRWQSIRMVVLKAARNGIVAAVILGMGRAIGETMAVIMVAGNTLEIPNSFLAPVRTLTSNIALEMGYASGDHRKALFATGVVLFVIIMILNTIALTVSRAPDFYGGRQAMRIKPAVTQGLAVTLLWSMTAMSIAVLIGIIVYILWHGLPQITWSFLTESPRSMGREGGIFPMVVSTIYVAGLAVLIAAPIGVGTAVYLTEYTRESRLTHLIRFGADCLAGIPSIIFGLFGWVFFVITLGMGLSILAGALTLAMMVLPTIIRTSEEAIRAVPASFREVSFGLGSTRWQMVTRVVLRSALPGISTGIVLSIARCIEETAVVMLTAGSVLDLPRSIFDSSRTMSLHFFILSREGISMEKAYGVATVLILSLLGINLLAYWLMHRFISRGRR